LRVPIPSEKNKNAGVPRVYPFNKDSDFKTLEGGEIIALVFQISPEMVFWVGFWGPNFEA